MARQPELENSETLARIAWYYYRDDRTQQEIGLLLGMTRQRVMRALRRARDTGIVEIRLEHSSAARLDRERQLRTLFDLTDCVVVPVLSGSGRAVAEVGRAAAQYIARRVRPGEILGTSWGRTLHEVAIHLPRRSIRGLGVVLLNGALARGPVGMGPFDLASAIADRFNAQCTYLLVPAVVASPQIREAITSDGAISEALALARRANKAILGIGNVTDDAALVEAGPLTPAAMASLRAQGAVGDVLGRFYNLHGRPIHSEIDDRVIGLDYTELQRIPTRIAVAEGKAKAAAILGALRGGYANVLITDDATAQAVLRLAAKDGR
jgi:DNA-binding transcriptional regulator LsrR (DeoR family)